MKFGKYENNVLVEVVEYTENASIEDYPIVSHTQAEANLMRAEEDLITQDEYSDYGDGYRDDDEYRYDHNGKIITIREIIGEGE